jgi:TonB-dependent receptor
MFKKQILVGAISIISMSVLAGEAVFYVTEDGQAVSDISVMVDGKKKLVGKNGFVSFDLKGGSHKVELSQIGEWAGEFEFNADANQNAEVKIEMIGGEALEDVNVYTPGQDENIALGKVSGYLESEETGGGVEGARISVEGTQLSVITDIDGYYELEIPRGTYTLTVAHPSYGNREVKNLRVIANVATSANLNLSMSGDSMIEEVVAIGSYIPSTATAQQRDSSAVLNAIGSEQMSRFGDSSAASALKRVAGVSLIGGQYAVIRGLKGRYISSTLNDFGMPSTDPMRRDVPLDLFPASVLGSIEIQKSYTPDLPGDTTGGSIRMKTKGLPDDESSKLSVSLGFNSQVTGKDTISYNGSDTDFIGVDDGIRGVPGNVDSATINGELVDSLTTADKKDLLNSFENSYNTKNVTAQPNVSLAYSFGGFSPNEKYSYYGAVEYKSKWSSRENAIIDDTSGNFSYERSKFNVDLTGYFVTGFETDNGGEIISKTIFLRKTDDTTRETIGINSEEIDIRETSLQWVERQFFSQQFSGMLYLNDSNTLDIRAGVSSTNRYEPDRRTYGFRNNLFSPTSLKRRYSNLSEVSLDVGVDHTYEMNMLNGDLFKIKTGLLINQKDREVDLTRYGLKGTSGLAVLTDDPETILAAGNSDFYLGTNTSDTDSYDATETMLSVYQSYEYELGDSWVFLAGARLEDASQELTYARASDANNSLDTNKVLPVISATWKPTDEWQFRLGGSTTLARPGLTELSRSSSFDPDTDEQMIGNPNLELSTITNLDFRAEYYITDSESISLALFNKSIDKPIEKTVADGSGSVVSGYTFTNTESADILGAELDFRIDVIDTNDYSGFLSGNFSWVDSEVTLDAESIRLEGSTTRALQGQSEILANLQFGLDHLVTGQTFTILLNHFGDRIDKLSRGELANEYEKGRMSLDFVYKWELSEELTIKGKASNLTNAAVEFTQNDRVIKSYETGVDASIGVDYIF